MRWFTMAEFIRSEEAGRRGIINEPNAETRRHIVEAVENLFDPLREAWAEHCAAHNLGSGAIIITSGFRNAVLNHLVGGSATSSHITGYAADIKPGNGHMKEFKAFCLDWLLDKQYDQFISENEKDGVPQWIHIGYKRADGSQRRQNLRYINGRYSAL